MHHDVEVELIVPKRRRDIRARFVTKEDLIQGVKGLLFNHVLHRVDYSQLALTLVLRYH